MYLTLAELRDRVGEKEIIRITNDRVSTTIAQADLKDYLDGNTPSPSADILIVQGIFDAVLADAEAEINSYITAEHTLPFETALDVPLVITNRTAEIVRHKMHRTARPTDVTDDYKAAIEWLKLASKRRVNLALDRDGDETQRAGGPAVATKTASSGGVFTSTSQESRFLDAT